MVLSALVEARYQFLLADFGTNGRVSDGGVLRQTIFFSNLQIEDLKIPEASDISENFKNVPYVIIADDAFHRRTNLVKPFRQAQLDSLEKEIFNYGCPVEYCFGIRAALFHQTICIRKILLMKLMMPN